MVEEVDIYPSLLAMHWGAAAVPADLEGESFVPLLQLGAPPGTPRRGRRRSLPRIAWTVCNFSCNPTLGHAMSDCNPRAPV